MIAVPSAARPTGDDALAALEFPRATKAQIADRQLLCRIDSKYVVPAADAHGLLDGLGSAYAVLGVPTGIWATYRSLYFDTAGLTCFHDHRRGRRVRHKIRVRHYPDRGLSYLEVKTKRNAEITRKHRLAVTHGDEALGDRELQFLREHVAGMVDGLAPVARIDYRRLSLVGLSSDERVTVDVALEVGPPGGASTTLGPFAVIELKRSRLSVASPMARRLSQAGHHEHSLSKYCAAIAQLRPDERTNRLLPSLRIVEKIAGMSRATP